MNSLEKRIKKKHSKTGRVFELSVLPALEYGGYEIREQEYIGQDFAGGLRIDIVARNVGEGFPDQFLISLKWQQVGGTAEQKIPFEIIRLKHAIQSSGLYRHAYLVLGGPIRAWTLRNFYISDEFERHLPHRDYVTIMTWEEFTALANNGDL